MSESDPPVEIALRIPGTWSHPKELIEKLPTVPRCLLKRLQESEVMTELELVNPRRAPGRRASETGCGKEASQVAGKESRKSERQSKREISQKAPE